MAVGERAGGPALLALAFAIVVLPFTSGFPLTDEPYPHLRSVPWADIASAVLVVAVAPLALRKWRTGEMGLGVLLWGLLLVPLAVSFAVHPSVFGIQILLRVAGAGAAAVVVASLASGERILVLGYLAAITLAEIALAWMQIGASGPLGIPGETPLPYEMRGAIVLARGTLYHGYVLAALGMVCAGLLLRHGLTGHRPLAWVVLAGLAIQPVGMAQSRAALLGYAAAVAALAWAARSSGLHRWAVVAVLVGAAVPAILLRDAWIEKATPTQLLYTADRVLFAQQSEALITGDPLLGVGPGNYVSAARARLPGARFIEVAHNFTLLVTAEGGVVAGLISVALLLGLAWSALRGGPDALALFFLFVPFMLFDAHPYVTAQGAVMTGLWIGGIDATGAHIRDLGPALARARGALRGRVAAGGAGSDAG
jgi:hypothetical protein